MNSELKFSGFKQGASAPLGATVYPGGVNFSVFSKNATLVELLLFDAENAAQPAKVIPLDSRGHRTYHYWHVFVPGLKPGKFMPTVPMDRLRWNVVFGSTAPRFCSTLMVCRSGPRILQPQRRKQARRQRRRWR